MLSKMFSVFVFVVVVMSCVLEDSLAIPPPHHLTATSPNPGIRDPKFLNLPFLQTFVTVHVEPESCLTTTDALIGVCSSSLDCSNQGGRSDGSCSNGFGVCCIYEKKCGDTVRTNSTYLVNKEYPDTFNDIDNCQYSIYKVNNDVCQLRLDFEPYVFWVQITPRHVPRIPSVLWVQLVPILLLYVERTPVITCTWILVLCTLDLGAGNGGARVNIATTTRNFTRSWRIRVTQLPCSSASRAPPNCLQYHTEYSGTIRSYNYQNTSGLHQLGDQQYTTCIRTREGFCGIKYMSDHFSLTKDGDAQNSPTSGDQDCDEDFVLIPSVDKNGAVTKKDRYCGSGFDELITYSKPFEVRLTTDSVEPSSDQLNRGYSIRYTQIPC
ncbi:hypothetical protein Pcinc_032157 [Petrolisthes cinctipes]|uniref:CUB domain-containing protein n=1 Tax=Petrolisthes cinctipes TaxID=88211 RepID=A0AAE1EUQ3_PETCI|nr:hypothetical protein Pcinc_032157 [Petrolisthes cinctipes]